MFKFYHQRLLQIIEMLPEQVLPEDYERDLVITRGQPIIALLFKEIQRYNVLLGIVGKNLNDTLSALKGE